MYEEMNIVKILSEGSLLHVKFVLLNTKKNRKFTRLNLTCDNLQDLQVYITQSIKYRT